MLERKYPYIPIHPRVYPFTGSAGRMRGESVMSDFTARSLDSFSLMYPNTPHRWGMPRTWGHNEPSIAPTPVPASVLPPIQRSLDETPAVPDQAETNRYHFWKQSNQWPNITQGFWPQEPGAEKSPRTTFQMTFTPRDPVKVDVHHRRRSKPLPKPDRILPDDPKSYGVRLLPAVDREKMVEIRSKMEGPKKLMDPPTRAAGIFYSNEEAKLSEDEPKYWKSLTALNGKEFSRKRELFPKPTQMTVHYFNGGAPASPQRQNRRTMFPLKRCDSSRVDFSHSLYGKDKGVAQDDNFV